MPRVRNPEEKYTRPLQEITGVAAGQTASIRLPLGSTYHQVLLEYSGVTLAQMTEIRAMINGSPQIVLPSGTLADVVNQYEGRAAASGTLVLDLERYGLATKANRELTALGTGHPKDPNPIRTAFIEVDIDAAAAAPALTAKARMSGTRVSGLVKHVRKFILNPSAAGDFEWSNLPLIGALNKLHFSGTGINSIKASLDNFEVFNRTAAENNLIQTDGIRVPQSNFFVLDPSELGDGQDFFGMQGAEDVRFTLNMAAATTVTVLAEYMAPVGA